MIELTHGALRLILDAETGGAVAAFTHDGVPLFRPVADARLAAQNGRAVAGYPLIPFANRIACGRFDFGGAAHQLGLNFTGHPHTIHGNAWMRRWTRLQWDSASAHLALDHTPPKDPISEWPFAYRAEQVFTLRDNCLQLTLSLENRDVSAWPAGIGYHPYVARNAGPDGATALQFDADTVWLNGPDSLPSARESVAHTWDFSTPRKLADARIDECYAGWGGMAEVHWPEQRLSMCVHTDPPLDHLQLYTPLGCDYFGLEPVSNMPDAINRMDRDCDNGLRLLPPGGILRGTIRFEVVVNGF